jgi:hypothetical protein
LPRQITASLPPPGWAAEPHLDRYVNDVLYYAARYGGGIVPGDPNGCRLGSGDRRPPSFTNERVANSSPGRKATM